MATVEKIEDQLAKAENQLNEAKAALKNFEEGKRGQKLKMLEDKLYEEEELTEKEDLLKRLEEVKKKLEIEKDEWKAQVQKLQNSLMEITKIGNDFVTCDLNVGDRVYDFGTRTSSKRPRSGIVHFNTDLYRDKTKFLCENLIQPFDIMPTHADQLVDLINTPLLAKLPVCLYSDLGKFRELDDCIYYDEIDRASELASVIKAALSETRFTQIKTEIELVAYVDILIIQLLRLLCSNSDFQIEFSRNATEQRYTTKSKSNPATRKKTRPDLLGYVKDVVVIKNEEKAARIDLEPAKEELISKFSKLDPLYFGNIQFLICFAVANDIMCFYAIDGPSKTLVPLSTDFYLYDLKARYTSVKICINIVRILKTMITKNAFPAKVIPLGKSLDLGHSTITFFEDHVEKVVPESELYGLEKDCKRVDTLKDMYELAKADRKGPGRYTVKLKTRGLERLPENEEKTRVMTRSLLTGLKTLHEKDFVHRDIRSSNIIYDSNNSQGYEYVLIDFEHGGKINEKFDSLLTDWDDGTCDENNTYTTLSDMYQLGKLLERLNTVSSDDGKDFISKLKKKMLGADAALQHPWITLHEKDFVHRDIRSSNIIYDSNNSQGYEYVLVDFEHGGKINEKFDSLLTDWDDGTCDENNTYTTLSDMYQLGKLLERLNTVSSDDGKDFI
ncbi:hypothetical protein G9A89_008556, partial [Geosiphon pyriformis]